MDARIKVCVCVCVLACARFLKGKVKEWVGFVLYAKIPGLPSITHLPDYLVYNFHLLSFNFAFLLIIILVRTPVDHRSFISLQQIKNHFLTVL